VAWAIILNINNLHSSNLGQHSTHLHRHLTINMDTPMGWHRPSPPVTLDQWASQQTFSLSQQWQPDNPVCQAKATEHNKVLIRLVRLLHLE
jgi:hypothetical protein